jgi:hypothetical protein
MQLPPSHWSSEYLDIIFDGDEYDILFEDIRVKDFLGLLIEIISKRLEETEQDRYHRFNQVAMEK